MADHTSPGILTLRPMIDPRIRQRRIEVQRAQGRRRLRVVAVVVALVAAGIGSWLALTSSLLDVDHRRVLGAAHTPAAAVLDAARIDRGEAMVDVDDAGAVRRVEELPWVKHAHVRRQWPHTVVITVEERVASVVTRTNTDSWAILDDDGRVLEVTSQRPDGLIEIEGVLSAAAEGVQPGTTARDLSAPLAVVRTLSPALSTRTAAVVMVQSGEIALKLKPRGTVRLGSADEVETKVRAIETILASLDISNLAILDVRLPSSPVLTRG